MKATATIGEYSLADSARVYVVPCPTGDSLVDRESVRKVLPILWSESHWNDPPSNRLERGAYVYDSLGTDITVVAQVDSQDTPCQNANRPTRSLPVITGLHVEPFALGDILPWQACIPDRPQPADSIAVKGATWGGPSAEDWVRSWTDHKPHIMMDPDSIYRFGPPDSAATITRPGGSTKDVPVGDWRARIVAYPRSAGTCTRP
jgi:hypothetical protein